LKLRVAEGRRPGYVTVTVFAGVAASVAYALLRMFSVIPGLPCWWRELLGIKCAGCGTTTALQHLLRLEPLPAFSVNPLISAAYILGALICVNGLVGVVAGRRLVVESSQTNVWIATGGILGLLALNWVYVYLR